MRPEEIQSLLLEARYFKDRGDYLGALRVLEGLLARQAHHLEALRLRGELLVALELHAEAAENQLRIDRNPGEFEHLLRPGQEVEAAERLARMGVGHPAFRACLQRLLAHLDEHLDPGDGVQRPARGQDSLLDWQIFAVRRIQRESPDQPEIHVVLGDLLLEAGQLDASEQEYRRALRRDLNHQGALVALGQLCIRKGQLRDAELAYKRLMKLSPGPEFQERLGEVHFLVGLLGDAVEDWLQAAEGYRQRSQPGDAIRVLQHVLRADRSNPSALRGLSELGA